MMQESKAIISIYQCMSKYGKITAIWKVCDTHAEFWQIRKLSGLSEISLCDHDAIPFHSLCHQNICYKTPWVWAPTSWHNSGHHPGWSGMGWPFTGHVCMKLAMWYPTRPAFKDVFELSIMMTFNISYFLLNRTQTTSWTKMVVRLRIEIRLILLSPDNFLICQNSAWVSQILQTGVSASTHLHTNSWYKAL